MRSILCLYPLPQHIYPSACVVSVCVCVRLRALSFNLTSAWLSHGSIHFMNTFTPFLLDGWQFAAEIAFLLRCCLLGSPYLWVLTVKLITGAVYQKKMRFFQLVLLSVQKWNSNCWTNRPKHLLISF